MYTYRDLKQLLNKAKDFQLDMPIKIWGEEKGFTVQSADVLEEDYINPSGEGAEPVSSYIGEEDELFNLETEPRVALKGQIMLNID